MKETWFKRRLYGWGWIPTTWQGWAMIFLYLGLFLLFTVNADKTSPNGGLVFHFNLPALLLTVVFVMLVYQKGEKPMWQWGERNEDEDK